jgi:hypothetical protein
MGDNRKRRSAIQQLERKKEENRSIDSLVSPCRNEPVFRDQPMSRAIARLFTDHPASVDESYLQHMRFAGGFGLSLLAAGLAALAHAVVPCLFEKTASSIVDRLHQRMHNRAG